MRFALVLLAACESSRAPAPVPAPRAAPVVIDAAVGDAANDAAIDAAIDAAPALPAFELRTLDGPHASIRAYCAAKKQSDDLDEPGHAIQCETTALWDGKKKLAASPPFDEVRVFVVEGLDPHCQLGLRIGKDWYVLHEAVRCLGARAKSSMDSKVLALEVTDWQPGGAPELVLRARYNQSLEGYSPEDFDRTRFELFTVCGVGVSGVPSCTREIPITGTREEIVNGKKPVKSSFKIGAVAAPGQITITGETETIDKYLITPLAPGTYALSFP